MGSESIGRALVAFFRRPYRVTPLMVLLVSLIPLYLVTPHLVSAPKARPAVPLDAQIPLLPEWSIVYGALCFSLILLPVLCVREEAHIRLLVLAYLATWLPSYASFVIYPTIAPRPEDFVGEGFAAWSLQALYGADPPYNCFPSLHVGHSFVSAFAILHVHRGVGWGALTCAALVALSTLFTKQHYVVDLVAGVFLAGMSYAFLLRRCDPRAVPSIDRRLAPYWWAGTLMLSGVVTAGFGFVYWIGQSS